MTQVSQIFGGMENPNDLQLDNLSEADESDEENREDEIKKLLEEGLCNETFEYESDNSSHNATNHNNCSFVSNKENSRLSLNGTNGNHGNGLQHDGGFFKTPTGFNGNGAFDLNMLPNAMLGDGVNTNGIQPPKRSPALTFDQNTGSNGQLKNGTNGSHSSGSPREPPPLKSILSLKNKNGLDQVQTNREHEEVEVTNPTISLLHKEHCPQNENDGLGSAIWSSTVDNSVEQLKTLCDLRKRQIERSEETIGTLQKDKRALRHEIGLIKTEMVQLKSHEIDAVKFAELKEEEVTYLKDKIREAIDEFEKARRNEFAAKEETLRLQIENEKLQQEVKLLSSLGQSTQQAEISDVVRQLRDKHSKDISAWQKLTAELEGQIRTYKRTHQLLQEESFATIKQNVQTQTDFNLEEEIERRERELAAQEFQEEFGGCGDAFIEELENLSEREIVKRVRKEWRTEREKLVNHYRTEIKYYQHKLASLPSELYEMWQKTQEELGLNNPVTIRPVCRSTASMTDVKYPERKPHVDKSTSIIDVGAAGDQMDTLDDKFGASKTFKEESVQVNFTAATANKNDHEEIPVENKRISSSSTSETSSVVCQTVETVETYKQLAEVVDSWINEVATHKQQALEANSRSQSAENELKKLKKQFRQLQKMAVSCRREWKKQEDALKKKNFDMKAHYIEMLKTLNDKLAVIDQQ